MKKKNIIFFLPNFDFGGAAQSITSTITNLSQKKYNLYIFCLGKCAYRSFLIRNNINVIEIDKKKTIFAFNKIKKHILKINKSTKLNSIFLSNINYANVLSLIFLSNIKNLKIITVDRTPIQELNFNYNNIILFIKNFIIKYLIKYTYNKASARIGNSKTLSDDLAKFSKTKFLTIYPYTIKKIKNFGIKKINPNKIIKIIWIGRLSKEKSLITLIDAINRIKEENLIVKIYGNGPEKLKCLEKVKKFGLNRKIQFFGHRTSIDKYFKDSNLYVSTSFYEGFQNSMIEAINNNIPVISTNSFGGTMDILKKNKFGFTYNIGDDYRLSILIKNYIKNSKNFVEKAKLAKLNLKKFEFNKTNSKYEQIFDKL